MLDLLFLHKKLEIFWGLQWIMETSIVRLVFFIGADGDLMQQDYKMDRHLLRQVCVLHFSCEKL